MSACWLQFQKGANCRLRHGGNLQISVVRSCDATRMKVLRLFIKSVVARYFPQSLTLLQLLRFVLNKVHFHSKGRV